MHHQTTVNAARTSRRRAVLSLLTTRAGLTLLITFSKSYCMYPVALLNPPTLDVALRRLESRNLRQSSVDSVLADKFEEDRSPNLRPRKVHLPTLL